MKFAILFILFLTPAALTQAQQSLETLVGPKMAKSLGLGKLTEREKNQWVLLLRSMGKTNSSTLEKSAGKYVKRKGFEEVTYLGDVTRGFTKYAVFSWGFSKKACEKPVFLNLSPGKCFAKTGFGQLNSIIDMNGNEEDFLFKNWIEVER